MNSDPAVKSIERIELFLSKTDSGGVELKFGREATGPGWKPTIIIDSAGWNTLAGSITAFRKAYLAYLKNPARALLPTLQHARTLGEDLAKYLFSGAAAECGTLLQSKLKLSRASTCLGLRICIWNDNNSPELDQVPWELLRTDFEGKEIFLSLTAKVSIVRYAIPRQPSHSDNASSSPNGPAAIPSLPPFTRRMVFMWANQDCERAHRLDLRREWDELADSLKFAIKIDPVKATREKLREIIGQRPHIFHFAGHGSSGSGGNSLELDAAAQERITPDELAIAFSGRDVNLAVLAACESATDSSPNTVAGALLAARVRLVVGTQALIGDRQMALFNVELYRGLLTHAHLDFAMADARIKISQLDSNGDPQNPQCFVPVLYVRADREDEGTPAKPLCLPLRPCHAQDLIFFPMPPREFCEQLAEEFSHTELRALLTEFSTRAKNISEEASMALTHIAKQLSREKLSTLHMVLKALEDPSLESSKYKLRRDFLDTIEQHRARLVRISKLDDFQSPRN